MARVMLSSAEDGGDAMSQEARGKLKKLKGRGKQAVGIIVGDSRLEQQGSEERAEGAAQEGLGRARRKAGELVEEIGSAIKK